MRDCVLSAWFRRATAAGRLSIYGTALYQSETRTPSLPPPDSESGTVQFEAGTEQSESGTEQSEAGTEQSESGTEQSESGTEQSESGTVQSVIWYRAFQSCSRAHATA